jgi:hypothetical protein
MMMTHCLIDCQGQHSVRHRISVNLPVVVPVVMR